MGRSGVARGGSADVTGNESAPVGSCPKRKCGVWPSRRVPMGPALIGPIGRRYSCGLSGRLPEQRAEPIGDVPADLLREVLVPGPSCRPLTTP